MEELEKIGNDIESTEKEESTPKENTEETPTEEHEQLKIANY